MGYPPLTLFEWVKYPVTIGSHPKMTEGDLILPQEFFDILDECDPKQQIFARTTKTLTPTNMVGVIRIGDVTIQILPKLFRDHLNEHKGTIFRNLAVMLSYTNLKPLSSDLTSMDQEDIDMLELFLRIFSEQLHHLLFRCQHRQYLNRDEHLKFIKGRIQVNKYWNPAQLERIPCSFKELTQDTLLNRIFKFCATLMSRHTQNEETKEHLKGILQILEPVTYTHVTSSETRFVILDRLTEQFAPLLRFCEIYLRHSTITLQASQVEIFSLLIPMERVFEQFISGVLSEQSHLLPEGATVYSQYPGGHLAQTLDGRGIFELRPDIFIDHPRIPVIIDTKYKMPKKSSSNSGIKQSDIYQMFGYGAKKNVPALMLLYPDIGEKIDIDLEFSYENCRLSALLIRSITLTYDLADPVQWEMWLEELRGIMHDMYDRASHYAQVDTSIPVQIHV